METIPLIYTPSAQRQTLSVQGRIFALCLSMGCLAVLLTAAALPPSPEGVGTHIQMGFQNCQFLKTTGLPCPTCGLSTCFAWFVRGNWLASIYIQPMGFLLALATCACFWGGLYIALSGKPIHRLLRQVPATFFVPLLMGLAVAAWAWKIFIHLHGIDGWR
jgi:hypothetical protein